MTDSNVVLMKITFYGELYQTDRYRLALSSWMSYPLDSGIQRLVEELDSVKDELDLSTPERTYEFPPRVLFKAYLSDPAQLETVRSRILEIIQNNHFEILEKR